MSVFNDNLWRFNFALFKHLRDAEPESNLFFSPLSVTVALSMTLLGAKERTADEMLSSLGLKKENETDWHAFLGTVTAAKDKSPMTVANKMFVEKSYAVLSSYVDQLRQHYGVAHGEVSFATDAEGAVQTINKWVSDSTNAKIPQLLQHLENDTRVVLINAVHFKGFWENLFDKSRTFEEPFYVNKSKKVKVDMMNKSFKVPYYSGAFGSAIRLPFKEVGYSMLLMLPPDDKPLETLEEKLIGDPSCIKTVLKECREVKVDVSIPRFTLKWSKDVKNGLQKSGMKDLFSVDSCDLSGVSGARDLFVSAVVHEAVLEVTEEGAEAAAATAVVMMTRCMVINPSFRADCPFLVSILKDDSVVFFGRVTDPTAK